ncbi:hypothetical protein OO013_17300 [Mangrovivirga sp. M17]|uniref:Lipoprotein n=1 Tax=Mangrovivirga halotolerans TaxID=2993936 RepID=A0ABT3RWQ2_9BACT|nr:hypothetical protein [Mangrovivirga halotolerans]MCX2745642.1 hypothetical protein [Mangrovivirga halotolerans]
MQIRILTILTVFLACCQTKSEKASDDIADTTEIKTALKETKSEKPVEPEMVKYQMKLFGEYSVADFVKNREDRLRNEDSLTFESITEHFYFEGGRDFIYPQLHSVDSGVLEFFDPYNSTFEPTIEYFENGEIQNESSIPYRETSFYLNDLPDTLQKRFTNILTTNVLKELSIQIAVNKADEKASIIIFDSEKQEFKEFKIPCQMDIAGSYGYAENKTNVGNYNLQQSIYFDVFQSYLFLTVDDFDFVTVFDWITRDFLICEDISNTVTHPVFIGITMTDNIVFYDAYDYTFKVINRNSELITKFEVEHPDNLEGVNYSFDRTSNTLFMSGLNEDELIQKIYSKRITTNAKNEDAN